MAPPQTKIPKRSTLTSDNTGANRKSVLPLRSQNFVDQNYEPIVTRAKRKADAVLKDDKSKRLALGNLPNNILPAPGKNAENDYKKLPLPKSYKTKVDRNNAENCEELPQKTQNSVNEPVVNRICTRATAAANKPSTLKAVLEESSSVDLKSSTRSQSMGMNKNIAVNTDSAIGLSDNSTNSQSSSDPNKVLNGLQEQSTESEEAIDATESKEILQDPKQNVKQIVKDTLKYRYKPTGRRISEEFEKSGESFYMSALEETIESTTRFSGLFAPGTGRRSISDSIVSSTFLEKKRSSSEQDPERICPPSPSVYSAMYVPKDVVDFDKENWDDPYQVSEYAMDIFEYLKEREVNFLIKDYISYQVHISKWMRSLLVDWMVEVQETFELNHETLYLAVKLVDMYLGEVIVVKDKLQLLGAAALFIASKYDERTPPLIEDFRYICDGAYDRQDLLKMEMDLLKIVDFDLGIPLSYRFLRRYARCAKIPMPTLTLARYILELSLMDYALITFRDSLVACAALYIALRMKGEDQPWNKTLEFYSGYVPDDFCYIIALLNANLHRKPKSTMKTVHSKYSHAIFFSVAKIHLLSTNELLNYNKRTRPVSADGSPYVKF